MTSSHFLRAHTGIECSSTLKCGLRHIQLLRQHHQGAFASRSKARCGTQICGTQSIIRAVASDFAKRADHTRVESSITRLHTSTANDIDAPASSVDLSLIHSHLYTHEASKEISIDVLGKGRLVEDKQLYRQMFVIRSYEVGFDKTAPIETITNLFQEISLNHVDVLDFVGDGMGISPAMIRNRLIWVMTRMQIEMVQYPVWGDLVQIDTCVRSSGKNGLRRDFLMRDYGTGLTLGRATSKYAMMNKDTRKLSKMPEEVRAEVSPCFWDSSVMSDDDLAFKPIPLLDDSASFRSTGLAPKLHDLDMNVHVNHVKYIDWILECLPQSLLMSCELSKVTLEYRRECGSSDMLESLAQSDMASNAENAGLKWADEDMPLGFTHLLRFCGSNIEVLRGRTQWRPKGPQNHHLQN